jgi:hypothetical protein
VAPESADADPYRRDLTAAEIERLGKSMGLTPKQIWEWIRKALKGPGKKIPRPGHGLPSFDVPGWLILALVGYLMWQGDR